MTVNMGSLGSALNLCCSAGAALQLSEGAAQGSEAIRAFLMMGRVRMLAKRHRLLNLWLRKRMTTRHFPSSRRFGQSPTMPTAA